MLYLLIATHSEEQIIQSDILTEKSTVSSAKLFCNFFYDCESEGVVHAVQVILDSAESLLHSLEEFCQ